MHEQRLDYVLGDDTLRCCSVFTENGVGYHEMMCYYPNGVLAEKQQYINGMPNGLRGTYYSNGVLKESQYFVLGFPAGDWKTCYPCGKLSSVGSYIYAPDELTYEVIVNSAEKEIQFGLSTWFRSISTEYGLFIFRTGRWNVSKNTIKVYLTEPGIITTLRVFSLKS